MYLKATKVKRTVSDTGQIERTYTSVPLSTAAGPLPPRSEPDCVKTRLHDKVEAAPCMGHVDTCTPTVCRTAPEAPNASKQSPIG